MTPFLFGILLFLSGVFLLEAEKKYRYKIAIFSPHAKSSLIEFLQFIIGGITFCCIFVGGGIVLMGIISLIIGVPFNEWD